MRVIAGPNGSGKSTLQYIIGAHRLGVYVNADEIEKSLKLDDGLDLAIYSTSGDALISHLRRSTFPGVAAFADVAKIMGERVSFPVVMVNSYLAASIAEHLREALLGAGKSFTFETVMSSEHKLSLFSRARQLDYRVYLYFVATSSPTINVSRVASRVRQGGHDVP